jgi:hypothetical protein
MEIQRSMWRSYHAFAKSHPLISVTFSTPTGFCANRSTASGKAILCNMDRTFVDRTASESERQGAREVATAILDGRITVLEAVRKLVSLAHTDAISDVEDRRLIIGIESETGDLPVGEARKLWAPDALETKDVEIARCEELYKTPFLEACRRIAGRPVNERNGELEKPS